MSNNWSGSVRQNQNVQLPSVNVLEGTDVHVVMTGKGDPDLYVRFGAQPSKTEWFCRPYKTGPNEQCDATVPAGESTMYIMVRGYESGQFKVTANYVAP